MTILSIIFIFYLFVFFSVLGELYYQFSELIEPMIDKCEIRNFYTLWKQWKNLVKEESIKF